MFVFRFYRKLHTFILYDSFQIKINRCKEFREWNKVFFFIYFLSIAIETQPLNSTQLCAFHLFLFLLFRMIPCPLSGVYIPSMFMLFGRLWVFIGNNATIDEFVCWRRQSHSIYISLPSKCGRISFSSFYLACNRLSYLYIKRDDACSTFKEIHESNNFPKGDKGRERCASIELLLTFRQWS